MSGTDAWYNDTFPGPTGCTFKGMLKATAELETEIDGGVNVNSPLAEERVATG